MRGFVSVGQICTEGLVSVDVNDSVLEAARRMIYRRVGAVGVLDRGTLAGIISEADVVCALVEQANSESTPVRDYMTEAPLTVSVNDNAALAARYMLEHEIGHLPVVDGDQPVGMLTRSDLLAVGAVPLPHTT